MIKEVGKVYPGASFYQQGSFCPVQRSFGSLILTKIIQQLPQEKL